MALPGEPFSRDGLKRIPGRKLDGTFGRLLYRAWVHFFCQQRPRFFATRAGACKRDGGMNAEGKGPALSYETIVQPPVTCAVRRDGRRYMPPPSLNLYDFAVGFALRTRVSVKGIDGISRSNGVTV